MSKARTIAAVAVVAPLAITGRGGAGNSNKGDQAGVSVDYGSSSSIADEDTWIVAPDDPALAGQIKAILDDGK